MFNGSYFQNFPFMEKLELGSNNLFTAYTEDSKGVSNILELKVSKEYIPFGFSDDLEIKSEIVFVGYGISAKDLEYDDYAGVDVKDKIVVVFRNHPDMKSPHSKFEQYSSLRYKTTNARDNGAKGIIFVNTMDKTEDLLTPLRYDDAAKISGIVAVQVQKSSIEFIPFNELQNKIDSTLKPNSFMLNKKYSVEIKTEVNEVKGTSVNVGGIIKATNNQFPGEYLVIGAHFDHLGWGGQNSLYMGEPSIHNGADDNASGTTGLLELAEKFSSIKDKIDRDIVFIAFSGEELGLLGSSYVAVSYTHLMQRPIFHLMEKS